MRLLSNDGRATFWLSSGEFVSWRVSATSLVAIAPCRAFAPREYSPTIRGVFQPASRMMAASGAPSSTRSKTGRVTRADSFIARRRKLFLRVVAASAAWSTTGAP